MWFFNPKPTSEEIDRPVFIRGLSRSGGTLLVTLLDAHPDIAMSYELYPTLLGEGRQLTGTGPWNEATGDYPIDMAWLARTLRKAKNLSQAAQLLDAEQLKNMRTFILRSERGGLSIQDLNQVLKALKKEGVDFTTTNGRLICIEKCCVVKMRKEKKRRWGLKCTGQYDMYHRHWPQANFINIIRDGRDVLSSQMNTGEFFKTATPASIGQAWQKTHRQFREFKQMPGVQGYELFYEKLAYHPQTEVQQLCTFLAVPYDPAMLSFYDQDLTIYKSSHLSMKRISQPIDPSQIGRWQQDLTDEQLAEFLAQAREALVEFGYMEAPTVSC